MRRHNKSSRKNFIKMIALTLAMVTAMSVAKPCEVMAASVKRTMNINGSNVNGLLDASKSRIYGSTSHFASGGRVCIWISGESQLDANPAKKYGHVSTLLWKETPTGVSETLTSGTGRSFYQAWSFHRAELPSGSIQMELRLNSIN